MHNPRVGWRFRTFNLKTPCRGRWARQIRENSFPAERSPYRAHHPPEILFRLSYGLQVHRIITMSPILTRTHALRAGPHVFLSLNSSGTCRPSEEGQNTQIPGPAVILDDPPTLDSGLHYALEPSPQRRNRLGKVIDLTFSLTETVRRVGHHSANLINHPCWPERDQWNDTATAPSFLLAHGMLQQDDIFRAAKQTMAGQGWRLSSIGVRWRESEKHGHLI